MTARIYSFKPTLEMLYSQHWIRIIWPLWKLLYTRRRRLDIWFVNLSNSFTYNCQSTLEECWPYSFSVRRLYFVTCFCFLSKIMFILYESGSMVDLFSKWWVSLYLQWFDCETSTVCLFKSRSKWRVLNKKSNI